MVLSFFSFYIKLIAVNFLLYRLIHDMKYEAEIHHQLRHQNIVTMLGTVFEPLNYGIILEYLTYGSWPDFLTTVTLAAGE